MTTLRDWRNFHPVRRAIAIAITVAFMLSAGAAATAAPPDREIRVVGAENERLTGFTKLDCKLQRKGGKLLATGKSREGWRLEIHVNAFSGFGAEYPITYGLGDTNFVIRPTKARTPYYSNLFVPGGALPPFGGAVAFPGGKKTIGLGFVSAFTSAGGEDAVAVAGKAKCSYPKRGKG